MPTEKRQIIFSKDEVMQALRAYRLTHHDFLPSGDVIEFTLKPTAGGGGVHLTVACNLIYGETRQTINIEVADADVVELLIRCCLENNIPIPRMGQKSANAVDGMLALIIRYDEEEAPVSARPSR